MTAPSLTVAEVAARCGLSAKAVRRLIAAGELPAYRIAARLRVDPHDLESFLDGCRVRPERPPAPPRSSYVASTPATCHGTLVPRPDRRRNPK